MYVSSTDSVKKRIQLDEVATNLNVPRYFLGKVMKNLVKEGVLDSQKGPNGGFSINQTTFKTPLIKIVAITGEPIQFDSCVLQFRKCNANQPCALHNRAQQLRDHWVELLSSTTVGDLVRDQRPDFIKTLAVY